MCACATMKECEGLTRLYERTSVCNVESWEGRGRVDVRACVKIAEVRRPRVKAMCVCNIEMVGRPEDEATYMSMYVCVHVCVCNIDMYMYECVYMDRRIPQLCHL